MESKNVNISEEISKRKAEKGIENLDFLYQQIHDDNVEEEEEEQEEKKNENNNI